MDLLTKYRPVKSLEFYQRKILRFIHTSEGSEDLRSQGIPYGVLGFETPLHFIRCIPTKLCEEYQHDKLFEKVDKLLRKGIRVFLTTGDGKIQSAIYKGEKQTSDGEWHAVLDGHRSTYPVEQIVPYKSFLRGNVGQMLIDGPHKVVDQHVFYEEPKWDTDDIIYHKPSKRWGTIEAREFVRGKVVCKIKMEQTQTKKEKIVKINLPELRNDAVPYRVPIIPRNNANNVTPQKVETVKDSTRPTIENVSKQLITTKDRGPSVSKISDDECANMNKLTKQISKESENSKEIKFRSSLSSDSNTNEPGRSRETSHSTENELIDLQRSPGIIRLKNDYTEAPAVTLRNRQSKSMRPLTEYFHAQSEDLADDFLSNSGTPEPNLKSKSVNNLNATVSEEGEFTFENYTNSLRRSARNVLAHQVAAEARQRSIRDLKRKNKSNSRSTDNLESQRGHQSIPSDLYYLQQKEASSDSSVTTSANDTCTSGTESPPPLPPSLPPITIQQQYDIREYHQQEKQPYSIQNPVYERTPSVVERHFTEKEPIERNYENSNYHHSRHNATPSLPFSFDNHVNYSLSDIVNAIMPLDIDQNSQQYRQPQHQSIDSPSNGTHYDNLHHATSIPVFDFRNSDHRQPQQTRDRVDSSKSATSFQDEYSMGKLNGSLSRYKKNPSAIRREHFHKVKSVPNMFEREQCETPLPQPFTTENIHTAIGKGRGIQTGTHSSYADVSLFALFYCSNIFDNIILKEIDMDRGIKKDIKDILRHKIVKPLRLSAFCSRESVGHLRESMLSLSSKLNSSYMDAQEFLYLLFENALGVPEFIKYSNDTKNFMHQIIVRPKDRSKCQDVQFLFETSMEINGLKFKAIPNPALLICMPRCNGRLVYYEAVIPNMTINITSLIDKGPKKCLCDMAATLECALCYKQYGDVSLAYCQTCQRMSDQIHHHIGHNPILVPKSQKNIMLNLMAVICVKNNQYSAFVKISPKRSSPWLYYVASPSEHPQVTLLEDFGRWLDKLEREPGKYREFAKTIPYLKRFIADSHLCIYYSASNDAAASSKTQSFVESFMI